MTTARWISRTLICIAAVAVSVSLAQTPPGSSTATANIARPSWATPERLRGQVDPASTIAIQVHLPLRNLEAAKTELYAVSDPDSPRYGQYLSTEEFESKYSPSVDDLAAVQNYLESEGFSVTYVPRNRLFVRATATAANVERVFATHLGLYEVQSGELRRAPMEPARLPAAIASRVSGVLGLSTSRVKHGALVRDAGLASTNTKAPTCADYYGEYFDTTDPPYGGGYPNPTPLRQCSLSPPRLRRAYGLDEAVESGNDGRGVSIAIVDAWRSPTLASDVQAFAGTFDPTHPLPASQITLIDAPSGGDPPLPVDVTWYYEQAGDVEIAHAIAPGAHIMYVGAATNGSDDMAVAVNLVVQDKLATIISNSWVFDQDDPGTASDSEVAALDPVLIQAGLKGIGTYFASGDWGDNQCGSLCLGPYATGPFVWYPASSPYTTAVGGTSLYLDRDGAPAYETGWETGESVPAAHGANTTWAPSPPGLFIFGAGGGPSHRYPQPNYQKNVVPQALAETPPARVIPDVAMLADFDSGVLYALTDPYLGTYVVYDEGGGTSAATPMIAGTMALAEQRAGHRLGFSNPRFYHSASTAFRDIVPTARPQSITHVGQWTDTEDPPNLQVQRPDGTIHPHTLHSASGFDNVTGLGVPAGEQFLKALASN